MANTKIPSELIDGTLGVAGISSSADATAITIDSSERVGFGTTSPTTAKVVISHAATELGLHTTGGYNYQAKFESTDAEAAIVIEDSNSTNDANRIGVVGNNMIFTTNNVERLNIDDSSSKMITTQGTTRDSNWGTEFQGFQMANTHIAGYNNTILFLGGNNVWSDSNYYRSQTGYSSQLVINDSTGSMLYKGWGTGSAGQLSSPDIRFSVTNDGKVTAPSQPHIFGTLTNTGGSGIANSWSDLAASSRSNLTVNTVSGQKRFTADVAGVYLVSITTIMDSSSVRRDTAIYHNGTKIAQTLNDEATGFHYRCWTHTIEMAANDYILVESDDWYDATNTNTVWKRLSMTLLS